MRRLVFLLSLILSCDPPAEVSPPDDHIVLAPETVLPESLPTFERAVVSPDQVVLTFTGPAEDIDLREGAVVVGSTDGGYLRRVTQAVADGHTITLQTTDATLREALDEADLDLTFDLEGEWEVVELLTADGSVAPPASYSIDISDIPIPNVDLFSVGGDSAQLSLTMQSTTASIRPTLSLGIELDPPEAGGGERYLSALSIDSDFDSTLILSSSMTASAEGSVQAVRLHRPFLIPVGSVLFPIVGQAELTVNLKGSVTATADASAAIKVEGGTDIVIEAERSAAGWTSDTVAETSFSADFIGMDLGFESQLDGRAEVETTGEVWLYGLAGLSGTASPWVEATICTPGGGSITSGLDALAQIKVRFLDDPLFDPWTWRGAESTLYDEWAEGWFADQDSDGFGDPERPFAACDLEVDWVENGDDCDDSSELLTSDCGDHFELDVVIDYFGASIPDRCVGTVEASDDGVNITGTGTCEFEGFLLLFVPGEISTELSGTISDGAASGVFEAYEKEFRISVYWTGEVTDTLLVGDMRGSGSIYLEGEVFPYTYSGVFAYER